MSRDGMLALNKLIAKGTPYETLTVLSWFINTRSFTISLPNEKHQAWSAQTLLLLTATWGYHEELDSLVERINHADMVTPLSRHFLGRIRHITFRFKNCRKTHLSKEVLADLLL